MNTTLLTADKPLKTRIVEVEHGLAKLVFSDGQSVKISAKFLPSGAKVGEDVYLNLVTLEGLQMGREKVAQAVLEEIIK